MVAEREGSTWSRRSRRCATTPAITTCAWSTSPPCHRRHAVSASRLRPSTHRRPAPTPDRRTSRRRGHRARFSQRSIAERPPALAASRPRREPPVLLQHILSAHRADGIGGANRRPPSRRSPTATCRAPVSLVGRPQFAQAADDGACPGGVLDDPWTTGQAGSWPLRLADRRFGPASGQSPSRADRHGGTEPPMGIVPGNRSDRQGT